MNNERQLAATTLEVAQQNLATAKLAHKKLAESVDLRTLTIAQVAATLVAGSHWPTAWGAEHAVKVAEELMAAAEASAAKAKELQRVKDNR